MIAELNGKISNSGSNLSDRLEDKLTGDFFGLLRYIPYSFGIKNILEKRTSLTIRNKIDILESQGYWDNNIIFWPYHKNGELDVLIETDKSIIGIEVKYKSLLSSEDNSIISLIENSKNQLAREITIVEEISKQKGKNGILIFLAPEENVKEISHKFYSIFKDDIRIEFSYLSWENILDSLIKIKIENKFYQLVIDDLSCLLRKKGFERFRCFNDNFERVDDKLYFSFSNQPSICLDFNYTKKINCGGYYEFK